MVGRKIARRFIFDSCLNLLNGKILKSYFWCFIHKKNIDIPTVMDLPSSKTCCVIQRGGRRVAIKNRRGRGRRKHDLEKIKCLVWFGKGEFCESM